MTERRVIACRKCRGLGFLRLPKPQLDKDGTISPGQLTVVCVKCYGLGSEVVEVPVLTADDHARARLQRGLDREDER